MSGDDLMRQPVNAAFRRQQMDDEEAMRKTLAAVAAIAATEVPERLKAAARLKNELQESSQIVAHPDDASITGEPHTAQADA